MALTELDSNPALIVIDLQKGVVAIPTAQPTSEVVQRSAELARAFRKRKWPVVLVNVTGRAPGRTEGGATKMALPPDWAELVPELEAQASDFLVTKKCVGAFIGTELDRHLREREVTQVFITGVSTSMGVEATARSAYDLGYHVVLVVDAMTDRNADSHCHCVEKIFPRLGETETTENILKWLA